MRYQFHTHQLTNSRQIDRPMPALLYTINQHTFQYATIVSVKMLEINGIKIILTTKIGNSFLLLHTSHHLKVCIENKFPKAGARVSKQDHYRIVCLTVPPPTSVSCTTILQLRQQGLCSIIVVSARTQLLQSSTISSLSCRAC